MVADQGRGILADVERVQLDDHHSLEQRRPGRHPGTRAGYGSDTHNEDRLFAWVGT